MEQHNIPNNLVILLSGVPCVGKTTTAYNILKKYPVFKRVAEVDIIKTVIKTVLKEDTITGTEFFYQHKYLFNSSTDSDFLALKKQASFLSKYVIEIIIRQQTRKIPTIIEGVGIVPGVYFADSQIKSFLNKNIIFINLFISNEEEHIKRRLKRCEEREYHKEVEKLKEKIYKNREKNILLHNETLELSKSYKNVFSIDISSMNEDNVIEKIFELADSFIFKN